MIRYLAQGQRCHGTPAAGPLSRPVRTAAIPLLVLGLATGCADEGPEDVNYDEIDPIVYSQHVQPILSESCNSAACHNSTDAALGLALESWDDVAEGGNFGATVLPFDSRRSHLYLHVTGEIEPRMPLARDPLPDAKIRFLGRWIDEGARNDRQDVMYSDATRKAFAACQGEDAVAVVDMDTGLLARLIRVVAPHSVYVDAVRNRLYVTRFESASDNLHVYDARTYELIDTARVGTFPALMKVSPDGTQLWISNFHTGADDRNHRVHVLNPDTLEEIDSFSRPDLLQPHGLAMSRDGSLVYVTNILTDNVTVFQNLGRGDLTILEGAISLPDAGPHEPQQCALSKDANESRLFISSLQTDRVYVLDTTSIDGSEGTPATFTAQVDVGDGPWHLSLSPDGQELWVANWLGSTISVVNVSDPDHPFEETQLAPVHPADDQLDVILRPIGIEFSPDGSEVWVACANDDNEGSGHHPPPEGEKNPGNLVVFDAQTRTVKSVAEVPNFARFVSFLP